MAFAIRIMGGVSGVCKMVTRQSLYFMRKSDAQSFTLNSKLLLPLTIDKES